jgi:uncharacterized membrane protein YkvA (DUF1232 family)
VKITFELEQNDIDRFQQALARARRLVETMDECDIVAAAKQSLDTLPIGSAPAYVRRQLTLVQRLILMLEDESWALPQVMREDVAEALVYFSDPEDLIPDELSVIGLLDDAIMLELLLRRQRHVLEAYDDYCAFRNAQKDPGGGSAERIATASRLARRRDLLHARMIRRATREAQQSPI